MQTADDNSKVFKTTFVLYSFKLILYFDTTAISSQIKYYLTTNRRIFLEMQYGFCRYALLADLLWLAVERVFTKNSRKAGKWLFGASSWKIIEVLWLVKCLSKFVFLDKRSWKVNVQSCGLHWYLRWLAKQD